MLSVGRTHRECANYSNGYCRLFNVRVDPNGPACPNFRPRQAGGEEEARAPAAVGGASPPLALGNSMGWRHRRRRRFRRGRGWLSRMLR